MKLLKIFIFVVLLLSVIFVPYILGYIVFPEVRTETFPIWILGLAVLVSLVIIIGVLRNILLSFWEMAQYIFESISETVGDKNEFIG